MAINSSIIDNPIISITNQVNQYEKISHCISDS